MELQYSLYKLALVFPLFTLGFVLMALILTTFIGILPIIYKVVRISQLRWWGDYE